MTPRLRLATCLILGVGLAGCFFTLGPFPHSRTIQYDLAGIDALPRLEPVSLYQFTDARGLVGWQSTTLLAKEVLRTWGPIREEWYIDHEPVAATVSRAFTED